MVRRSHWVLAWLFLLPVRGWSAAGTEGASFLDIPVGAGPSALAASYSAQATDVYAPVWNPGGLGFLHGVEFSGTFLNYVSPAYYGNAGVVIPLRTAESPDQRTSGIGAAIQYLGTGSIDGRTETGLAADSFTAGFTAFSLAYGRQLSAHTSLGGTFKFIHEAIADATAKAYAADVGLMYAPTSRLRFGAVAANMGTKIKFVEESDPLPMAGRFGGTYQVQTNLDLSLEGVIRRNGLNSGSLGAEWRYGDAFSFRGGYNTSRIKELGTAAGFSAGFGLLFWGQEFAFAWVPLGPLGQSYAVSLVFRTNTAPRPERPRLKRAKDFDFDDSEDDFKKEGSTRYENIFDLLNHNEREMAD